MNCYAGRSEYVSFKNFPKFPKKQYSVISKLILHFFYGTDDAFKCTFRVIHRVIIIILPICMGFSLKIATFVVLIFKKCHLKITN
jgi:hypothetical protein